MQCILREHIADIGTGGVVGLFRARGLLLFGGVDGMGVRCFNNFLTEKWIGYFIRYKLDLEYCKDSYVELYK